MRTCNDVRSNSLSPVKEEGEGEWRASLVSSKRSASSQGGEWGYPARGSGAVGHTRSSFEGSTEPVTASLRTMPFGCSATGGRTSSLWWLSSCSRAGGGGRRRPCCHHPCPIHPAFRWMGCQGCQTRRQWPGACKQIARQEADMRLATKHSSRHRGTSPRLQSCRSTGSTELHARRRQAAADLAFRGNCPNCSPVVQLRPSLDIGCVQHLLSLRAQQHTA